MKEKHPDFVSTNSIIHFVLRKNMKKKIDYDTESDFLKYNYNLIINDLDNHKNFFILLNKDIYDFYKNSLFKKYIIIREYKNMNFLLLKRTK